jgi:hypothetical protein
MSVYALIPVLDPSSNTRQVIGPNLMMSPPFAGTKFTGTSGTWRDLIIASMASSIWLDIFTCNWEIEVSNLKNGQVKLRDGIRRTK